MVTVIVGCVAQLADELIMSCARPAAEGDDYVGKPSAFYPFGVDKWVVGLFIDACSRGAIWWVPTRLRPGGGYCDRLAPFVLTAYARAKPSPLSYLACLPVLVSTVLRGSLLYVSMWLSVTT